MSAQLSWGWRVGGGGALRKAGSLGAEPSLEPGCGGNGVGGARADEPDGSDGASQLVVCGPAVAGSGGTDCQRCVQQVTGIPLVEAVAQEAVRRAVGVVGHGQVGSESPRFVTKVWLTVRRGSRFG